MMDFVSWDDDIPNWMESHKIHVPKHQPDYKSTYLSGEMPISSGVSPNEQIGAQYKNHLLLGGSVIGNG